jgi:ribonuclease HI
MKKAVFHSDGASLGNPGPAGIGVCLEFGGRNHEISEHIGAATNNVAEYSAFIRGLEEAGRLGAEEVAAYLDSELLVRQISGQYRVRNKGLIPYHEKALRLIRAFKRFTIAHVPREQNKEADRLSKQGAKDRKRHRPKPHTLGEPSATPRPPEKSTGKSTTKGHSPKRARQRPLFE